MKNLDITLNSLVDLVNYGRDKALYEVQEEIKSALSKMRQMKYDVNCCTFSVVTRDLNSVKKKKQIIEKRLELYPEPYKVLFVQLMDELDKRIRELRDIRDRVPC